MCVSLWNSHRRVAGVCAGGVWQEQSSPGGTEDCHADKLTPGLKRPEQQICKNKSLVNNTKYRILDDMIIKCLQ